MSKTVFEHLEGECEALAADGIRHALNAYRAEPCSAEGLDDLRLAKDVLAHIQQVGQPVLAVCNALSKPLPKQWLRLINGIEKCQKLHTKKEQLCL